MGELLAQALKESGFYTFGYREFPSLIKGGYAFHQVDTSDQQLASASAYCDLMICMSRRSLHHYLAAARENGLILYDFSKVELTADEQQLVTDKQLSLLEIPAKKIALEAGGKAIMANTVLMGVIWQVLKLDTKPLIEVLRRIFADKPDLIEPNIKCLEAGQTYQLGSATYPAFSCSPQQARVQDAVLTGNHALALGAVAAGVRAYFAYPMSPSSSILSYLADISHQTGMLVKQIEDEIAVANMTVGSMFMGTRALCATSGGGFDLMTETVSLAAMTETPFVCVVAQRPGPATGLPTWTSASDLNLAIHAGHGEFTRLVLAASGPIDCYTLIQQAFNLAEEFQIPVILLTEKQIAEGLFQVEQFPQALPIERHTVPEADLTKLQPSDRFRLTEDGISPRWFPGTSTATFNGNSDEHLEDGSLTEDAGPAQAMYDKRLRKEISLLQKLPDPELIGPATAVLSFIGWGSPKNTLIDALQIWNQAYPNKPVNYLHLTYLYPLKTEPVIAFLDQATRPVLIEQNATAQLSQLIRQTTGRQLEHQLLKYDGRPFYIEDLMTYLAKELA
jgi:2-oxoglutarate ferredoxin oxidoreductase subunit alpha